MSWLHKHKWNLVFLASLVVFSYFNSLNNEFVSDDVFAIVNNPDLGDFGQVLANPFYFLRPLEYWMVFSLFGKQAIYFRIISFVSHLLAVWGVYALVGLMANLHRHSGKSSHRDASGIDSGQARMTREVWGDNVGFVAAMLFAVHPLGVEAVSWISAGGYVQMAALGIWSLVFYTLTIRHSGKSSHRDASGIDSGQAPAKGGHGRMTNKVRKYYVWSVVLLLLALFTMERAVVVVGLMMLISWRLGKLKESWKFLVIPVVLCMVWIGVSVLGVGVRTEILQTNYYSDVESEKVSFLMQLPVAVGEYVKLFVWPVGLTLYHSDLVFTGFGFALRVVVLLGFLGGVVWTFLKNRQAFFWLVWFFVCLSPTLLPLGLSWIVAERYVYMAMIGLCVLVAMGVERLREKVDKDTLNFGLVLLVGALMFRTVLRNNDWQTADSLYLSAERYSTLSPQNHNNLGDVYGKRGELKRSELHFLKAIQINPRYADAMHNLGNTYVQMGELDKAKESYLNALNVNPGLWQSERALKAIDEYESKVSK